MKKTPHMSFNRKGQHFQPLKVIEVNGTFILAVYQGNLSEFDLLVKYRQKEDSGWSRLRTPKHIHWAVDLLIKLNLERDKAKELVTFLLTYWNETAKPLKDTSARAALLNHEIISEIEAEAEQYKELENKGEYSIKFLLIMAKLLMIQEKTNYEDAFMFKQLLEALEQGKDIFQIVSIATHNGR